MHRHRQIETHYFFASKTSTKTLKADPGRTDHFSGILRLPRGRGCSFFVLFCERRWEERCLRKGVYRLSNLNQDQVISHFRLRLRHVGRHESNTAPLRLENQQNWEGNENKNYNPTESKEGYTKTWGKTHGRRKWRSDNFDGFLSRAMTVRFELLLPTAHERLCSTFDILHRRALTGGEKRIFH